MPVNDGVLMNIKSLMQIEVSFMSKSGNISFMSKVLSKVTNNTSSIEIEKPIKIDRKELREFFRIEINSLVEIYSLKEDSLSTNLVRDKEYKVTCVDISGGGAKLISTTPMDNVKMIEADFSNIIQGFNAILAKILRCKKIDDSKFEIGIQFTSLSDSDRDKIVQFVFKKQIEARVIR